MPTLIVDQQLEQRLRAERLASGADRFDEVWEDLYVMNPMPNDEHQQLVSRFTSIFEDLVGWPGLGDVRPGVNVSDRVDSWRSNYRVPDVAVFLQSGAARNCGEFWHGGPDFVVEIVSAGDRTRDKLAFYAAVGVRELLVVDRQPWRVELWRGSADGLRPVACSTPENAVVLTSSVLPLTFQLLPDTPRPQFVVTHVASERCWRM
jgi:Uma2 family endonuclease